MIRYYLIFVLAVFLASVSQILLKKSSGRTYPSFWREYLNKYVISGYFLFGLSLLGVILAFKEVPYKFGAILEALGYIFLLFLSKFFLKEKITVKKVIGALLIILGLIVFSV